MEAWFTAMAWQLNLEITVTEKEQRGFIFSTWYGSAKVVGAEADVLKFRDYCLRDITDLRGQLVQMEASLTLVRRQRENNVLPNKNNKNKA